jgi:hypothetical protein
LASSTGGWKEQRRHAWNFLPRVEMLRTMKMTFCLPDVERELVELAASPSARQFRI